MTDRKRKPGRPALPAGAGKTARIELRVRPSLKSDLQAIAKHRGESLQSVIERALVGALLFDLTVGEKNAVSTAQR